MTTTQLCEDPTRTLTDKIFNAWSKAGYTNRPYALTWLEVNNLTKYFLKICREINRDYQEFDLSNILDHTLTYYENQAQIENELGGLNSDSDKEYYNKLLDEVEPELKTMEQLEEKNAELERKNKKIQTMLKQAEANRQQPKITIPTPPTLKLVEQPQPALIIEMPKPEVFEPTSNQYTQTEIAEIIEYLQTRSRQKQKSDNALKIAVTTIFKAIKWMLI
jgi:hypothetical protein